MLAFLGGITRAIFVIEHNGNRYIENFALVPYVSPGKQENFDFLGGDIASDIVNPHLKSLIDPQNIGKPVYFAFNIEERHTVTYDINMHDRYLAQKTNQDYQTNLLLLPSGLAQMNKYINNVMSNLDNQAKQQTSATEHADSLRKLADNANFVAHWEPIQKVTDTMTRGREMVHQMKEEDWLARQRDVQSVTDAMTKGRQMIADEQYKVWYTKQQKVQEVTDLLDAARNGTLGHRKQVHYETVRHVTHTKPRGLHEGSHGQGVVQLQKALNLLGANLHTDGHFGASTEKALKEFQKAHHLKVDGELDKQTIKVMVKAIKEQEAKLSHMVGQSSPNEVHGHPVVSSKQTQATGDTHAADHRQPPPLPANIAALHAQAGQKLGNQLSHLDEKAQQTVLALATEVAVAKSAKSIEYIHINEQGKLLMGFDNQRYSNTVNIHDVHRYDANTVLSNTVEQQQTMQLAQQHDMQHKQTANQNPSMTLH